MSNKIQKPTYFLILTTLSLIMGIGGALVFHYLWPENYFGTYPLIPVYFYVFGIIFIYLFERIRQNVQQRRLVLYSSLRMMKLMVSIIVLVVYGLFTRDHIKEFLMTFIIFYLVYLVFEILFFFNIQNKETKRLVTEKMNEN